MSYFSHRLIATAVVAALSLPVLAQTSAQTQATPAAAQAEPGQRMQQRDHQMRRHAPDRAKMQERMAQRMAAFKEKLQLSPAQQPAWDTFTTAMQPGERHARLDRQGMEQLTTPERIDRMHAVRTQRAAQADRRGEGVKTFYATPTPAQQKTFDAQTQRMQGGQYGQRHHYKDHKGSYGGKGMYQRETPAPATAS